MNKNITQNDLLLLAYNDLPPAEHNQLLNRVLSDEKWAKEYNKLKDEMSILDKLFLSPDPTSVHIVLEESCSSNQMETI
ncbi:MAG: hypothetical protein RLZZ337_1600 [Bacteroidota bacterium]|jgi:hypothetical protein